jgi:hypothetical protein
VLVVVVADLVIRFFEMFDSSDFKRSSLVLRIMKAVVLL